MPKPSGQLANFLLRHSAQLSGLRRVPLLGSFLSWISHQLVPVDTLIWVQIKSGVAKGLWLRLYPRTNQILHRGTGGPAEQEALLRHLRPGMTFYDLGANIGYFSLMAARMVGPSGKVIAFEADPEIASRLRDNLAYNHFTHVVVEAKAVWSASGTVPFARVESKISPDRGLGHVSFSESSPANTISVDAVSLDQYVLSNPPPDFLKCDVEGTEVAVFQGAERLLREKRPILLVEMHSLESHECLTRKFGQFGYACTNLDENHVLALPQ